MMTEETPITPAPPEGALVLVQGAGAEQLILHDPAALAAQLATYGEVRKLLMEWILSQLVAGIDYLVIHRKVGERGNKQECSNKGNQVARTCEVCGGKATLAKPGSEKITGLLQLRPTFHRDQDTWEMLGSEPGVVTLKCELLTSTGVVVAEGRGARHRDQDYGDLNKCIKMVQKSAQTDAVLRCAGLSEVFTQDLDDTGFRNGDDEPAEFSAPKGKSAPAPAPPPAPSLRDQLGESVRRAAAVPAGTPLRERAAMIRTPQTTPPPVRRPPAARAPQSDAPADALSPARVNRLFALLHEAVRAAEVPEEQHEGVFNAGRQYLTEWVGRTQGRERLADCSWKSYDDLCAQIPAAVDAALGQEGPPPEPRPRPRLVRRSYGAPKPFARRGY